MCRSGDREEKVPRRSSVYGCISQGSLEKRKAKECDRRGGYRHCRAGTLLLSNLRVYFAHQQFNLVADIRRNCNALAQYQFFSQWRSCSLCPLREASIHLAISLTDNT